MKINFPIKKLFSVSLHLLPGANHQGSGMGGTNLPVITDGPRLSQLERGAEFVSQQSQSDPSLHSLYTFLIGGPALSILLKYENPIEVHVVILLPIVNEYDKTRQILRSVSPGRPAALLLSFPIHYYCLSVPFDDCSKVCFAIQVAGFISKQI